jgi:hypothetical protein
VASDQLDVLSSDRRAKDVLAEGFTTEGIVCSGSGSGMQREAMGGGTASFEVLDIMA